MATHMATYMATYTIVWQTVWQHPDCHTILLQYYTIAGSWGHLPSRNAAPGRRQGQVRDRAAERAQTTAPVTRRGEHAGLHAASDF